MTLMTPVARSAALVSIALITPFEIVLYASAACTKPSIGYSAENGAAPVTFTRPSRRSIGLPRKRCSSISLSRSRSGMHLGYGLDYFSHDAHRSSPSVVASSDRTDAIVRLASSILKAFPFRGSRVQARRRQPVQKSPGTAPCHAATPLPPMRATVCAQPLRARSARPR